MPLYDYSCDSCGCEFEASHSMHESPKVPCEQCGSTKTHKLISACGIIVRQTGIRNKAVDAARRANEAKQDLRENYGVENVTPLRGSSVSDVYNDVRSQGSFVRDQMQQTKEQNDAARRSKQRVWSEGARKRTPERVKVKREKKAKEKAAKEAIRIHT